MTDLARTREERPPAELALGLVYPVGVDATKIGTDIENQLRKFCYDVRSVRLSDLLPELPLETKLERKPPFARFMTHMDAGNEARRKAQDGAVLAAGAIQAIQSEREQPDTPRPRTAYLLRSLKHPREVELLRRVYLSGFFLIGVFSSEESRIKHLVEDLDIGDKEASKLIRRDEEEADDYGQHTRATFELADVFVNVDDAGNCKKQLWRFLDLIFGDPFRTPTRDEYGMFLAYAASLRSSELSRQVGAAVFSRAGDLLSVGVNEVPAPGGGLYWEGDEPDGRDFASLGYDSNHRMRKEIQNDIVQGLTEACAGCAPKSVREVLKHSGLRDITEYGRSVHAEMEALLSCLRTGCGVRSGTLYVTTFPCHNCARHIIAAGISRVVYVEPYPKSKAGELHGDSIELDGPVDERVARGREVDRKSLKLHRVRFQPFEGVGPRRYFDLFSLAMGAGQRLIRKQRDGGKRDWKREDACPRVPMLSTSYLEREGSALGILDPLRNEPK